MIQECKFNPASDIEEVIPDLDPDISEIMATHTIPSTSALDSPYSNETDIKEVGHYLKDKIDIAIAQFKLGEKIAAAQAAGENAMAGSTSGENS